MRHARQQVEPEPEPERTRSSGRSTHSDSLAGGGGSAAVRRRAQSHGEFLNAMALKAPAQYSPPVTPLVPPNNVRWGGNAPYPDGGKLGCYTREDWLTCIVNIRDI